MLDQAAVAVAEPRSGIPRRSAARWSALVAAVVPTLLGFGLFRSTGRDDAYITYWAARSLARSGSIVNYNGHRLEQSSSLLHTVLLAALNRLTTVSVPTLGLWVTVVSGIAASWLAGRLAARIDPRAELLACALTATSPYLVYWSFGGLETPIVAAALVLVVLTAAAMVESPTGRHLAGFAAAGLVFAALRPEGALVLGCVGIGGLALASVPALAPGRRRAVRPFTVMVITAALSWGLLAAFRKTYFGAWVPQPVAAKVGGLRIHDGLHYVWVWAGHLWAAPVAIAAVGGVAVLARRSWAAALTSLAAGAYVGFIVLAGGDWMEAGRFLVPVLPLAAVLAAVAVQRLSWSPGRVAGATLLVGAQLGGVAWVAGTWSTGTAAWAAAHVPLPPADRAAVTRSPWYEADNRVHVRDTAFLPHLDGVVSSLLRQQRTVTLSSGQAGLVPYYLFQEHPHGLIFIDRGSLTTNSFAACSRGLVKSALGAGITMPYWITHQAECRTPLPDVIYNVGVFGAEPGVAQAYTLVYQQPAVPITVGDAWPTGEPVSAGEYVAVRNDLALAQGTRRGVRP